MISSESNKYRDNFVRSLLEYQVQTEAVDLKRPQAQTAAAKNLTKKLAEVEKSLGKSLKKSKEWQEQEAQAARERFRTTVDPGMQEFSRKLQAIDELKASTDREIEAAFRKDYRPLADANQALINDTRANLQSLISREQMACDKAERRLQKISQQRQSDDDYDGHPDSNYTREEAFAASHRYERAEAALAAAKKRIALASHDIHQLLLSTLEETSKDIWGRRDRALSDARMTASTAKKQVEDEYEALRLAAEQRQKLANSQLQAALKEIALVVEDRKAQAKKTYDEQIEQANKEHAEELALAERLITESMRTYKEALETATREYFNWQAANRG